MCSGIHLRATICTHAQSRRRFGVTAASSYHIALATACVHFVTSIIVANLKNRELLHPSIRIKSPDSAKLPHISEYYKMLRFVNPKAVVFYKLRLDHLQDHTLQIERLRVAQRDGMIPALDPLFDHAQPFSRILGRRTQHLPKELRRQIV